MADSEGSKKRSTSGAKSSTRRSSSSSSGSGKRASGRSASGEGKRPAAGRSGATARGAGRGSARGSAAPRSAEGKQLVIVESPAKAKTINKYLGPGYVVLASVGHVRDLPSKNPKGDKSPVPGVDLEQGFRPTYEVLPGKTKAITDLKRAAKGAADVWFATDLDREGEAIAWHLSEILGISAGEAKRVIFSAITKDEISRAFSNPHPINMDRVNAQQARRVLDRIVGYQVSPLLWKKVARGLSAGRVQSVAVRLIVEREREIRAFVPDEYWQIEGFFTSKDVSAAGELSGAWRAFLGARDEKGAGPTIKSQNAWLAERGGIRAELVEVAGEKFEVRAEGRREGTPVDLTPQVLKIAQAAGLTEARVQTVEDASGKGPARVRRTVSGSADPAVPYRVRSIETRRTSSRPPAPFITSTLQQAASTRLGFGAQRTMRAAQQLYEGVDIPGEGPVGLITYMRTDSTHLAPEAVSAARSFIERSFGPNYLPEKPSRYTSSNKAAQEAHEAIRPTSLNHPPEKVARALKPDQARLYKLIWDRFVACQMAPAQWDATTVLITGGRPGSAEVTFRASGRVLAFDGFYRVAGVPTASDEATLPRLAEGAALRAFALGVDQKFTSPPPRYTEASLVKTLEAEGIGRPSTYASIIGVIQDRKYVEQLDRRFYATDLGEVVTDKLLEAFPRIMDVGYTRQMEAELDKVEEDHLDWVDMLERFYGPFRDSLDHAMETLGHAKAEVRPAPEEYRCGQCGAPLVYRFGKNGRFLSCSRYPACAWACPVDREGRPKPDADHVPVACPKCGGPMTRRSGRFGDFLGCVRYGAKTDPCDGILNIDRTGKVVAPSQPPLVTELPCPTCQSPLNLRSGARGPWLGCSKFPKCRGRGKWAELPPEQRAALEEALSRHEHAHPVPIIRTLDGRALTDDKGKPLREAPTVEQLIQQAEQSDEPGASARGGDSRGEAPEPEEMPADLAG